MSRWPAIVLLVVTISSAQAAASVVAGGGDQSGTLIMIARTRDAAILSVDSKITHLSGIDGANSADPKEVPIDRKLVLVGRYSACGIAGFLGRNSSKQFDVATSLRRWTYVHPLTEASDAIDTLLREAAKAWDRADYPREHMPAPQLQSGRITTITYEGFQNGHPYVLSGQTIVKLDQTGRQSASIQRLPSQYGDTLYMFGAWDTTYLAALQNPAPVENWNIPDPRLVGIIGDLQADSPTLNAIHLWNRMAADYYRKSVTPNGVAAEWSPPPDWNIDTVNVLFAGVAKAVEAHVEEAGPPNIVVIVNACGRSKTQLDQLWPECNRIHVPSKHGKANNRSNGGSS